MKHWREECGVVGVLGDPDAANLAYLSLYALQHRGQEGCGIITFDHAENEGHFHVHKSMGLVADTFDRDSLAKLTGTSAIGHVRYSTAGGRLIQNVQPFHFRSALGPISIAQNGNLTNATELREELEKSGSVFQSTTDSEVFVHLIARSDKDSIRERLFDAMRVVKGAYSMTMMTPDKLYAVRDAYGFRPLVIGKRGNAHVVVSETCALDLIDAELVREVEPGEVVELSANGTESFFPLERKPRSFCAFEPIYFARPDSLVGDTSIYELRKKMGSVLAEEVPAEDADLVIAVPDSGVPMAMGFASAAGLPLELGLVRNHYVGRTFIEPAQEIRDFGVRLKLNPVFSALKGKNVVVVDDSIVRGTTSAKIMRMLRRAGVNKIHMRIGSPPITHSCFYGVDTPKRDRLLAAQKSVKDIRDMIGCDSIGYLSREGLRKALGDSNYCFGCFSGEYPESIGQEISVQPTDADGGPGLFA